MNQTNTIHKFEEAGLGKAPFYFAGTYEHHEHSQGDELGITDYGTNCDYCGQYIRNVFLVKSSDGKTFKVGSDCIKKVGDQGLIKLVNRELAAKRAKVDALAISEIKQAILNREEEVVNLLDSQPHPFMNDKTMFDYAYYIFTHGWTTTSGKRVLTAYKKAKKI